MNKWRIKLVQRFKEPEKTQMFHLFREKFIHPTPLLSNNPE